MTYYIVANGAFYVIPPAAQSEEEARRMASLMGMGAQEVTAVIEVQDMVTTLRAGGYVTSKDWGIVPTPEDVRAWASVVLDRNLRWGGDQAVLLRSLVRAVERLDDLFSSVDAQRYGPLVNDLYWLLAQARRVLPEGTAWVEPEADLVIRHRGVSVYTCLHGGLRARYTYTVDPADADIDDDRGGQFDVRDLVAALGEEAGGLSAERPDDHVEIVRRAIEAGLI